MKKFCIVIPIYKETLDCIEEISLKRLNDVIGDKNYDVFLVGPKSLDMSEYLKLYPNAKEKRFDNKFFKSTKSYSRLCLSYQFYNIFSKYKYMIIYQLDCYLFSDDFESWCDKNYDYIGGAIISNNCGWDVSKNPRVGNGGFSLRKIETFKDICDPDGEFRTEYNITDEILDHILWEDKFYCNDIINAYAINIPDWKTSLSFALDMSVDVIYNFFGWKGTPMAIHAWDKNIRWWKNILPELKNNNEVIEFCENKHKEFFKVYYDENDSTLRLK